MDYLAKLRETQADIDVLDALRDSFLHKRAVLARAALDSPENLSRMAIANAMSVTLNRMYIVANQGVGIVPADKRVDDLIPALRVVPGADVFGLSDSPTSDSYDEYAAVDWIAAPYVESSTE